MNYGVAEAAAILSSDREHVKTIAYCFSDDLSPSANPEKGKPRKFSFSDMLVLIFANYSWEDNPDIEAIKAGITAGDHTEEVFIKELWNHTPLLQNELPDHLDESARQDLVVDPKIHLESIDIARSYRNAANLLWENAAESPPISQQAYPVLFAYRHALELYLKLLGKTGRNQGHNLEACIRSVEQLYAERLPDKRIPPRLRDWMMVLHELNSDGCQFRYAPEQDPSMDGKWIEWTHFGYAMGQLFNALDMALLKSNQDSTDL